MGKSAYVARCKNIRNKQSSAQIRHQPTHSWGWIVTELRNWVWAGVLNFPSQFSKRLWVTAGSGCAVCCQVHSHNFWASDVIRSHSDSPAWTGSTLYPTGSDWPCGGHTLNGNLVGNWLLQTMHKRPPQLIPHRGVVYCVVKCRQHFKSCVAPSGSTHSQSSLPVPLLSFSFNCAC